MSSAGNTYRVEGMRVAQAAAANSGDPGDAARKFLEDVKQMGVDRNHPFLRDFRPDNHDSIALLKTRITAVSDEATAVEVLEKYAKNFADSVKIEWTTISTYQAIAAAYMTEPQNTRLWYIGKFIEQLALDFLRHNEAQCPKDRYECDDVYSRLKKEGRIIEDKSLPAKVVPRIQSRGLGYTLSAIWRNTVDEVAGKLASDGVAGIGREYIQGELRLKEISGALPGFLLADVRLGEEKIGTLIIGDPREGARAGLRVRPGGRVSGEELKKEHGSRLQYQGTLAMQSEEGAMPLGTIVINGNTAELNFDQMRLEGLVMTFPDGRVRIVDKRQFSLADVTGDPKDAAVLMSATRDSGFVVTQFMEAAKKARATILSGALHSPHNPEDKWRKQNGDSNIRLFFTFEDGKFGIFDTPRHSTNEMLAIIYRFQERFGPVKAAVRCDRGTWDSAAYYKNGTDAVTLGEIQDDPSNRLYFWSEENKGK